MPRSQPASCLYSCRQDGPVRWWLQHSRKVGVGASLHWVSAYSFPQPHKASCLPRLLSTWPPLGNPKLSKPIWQPAARLPWAVTPTFNSPVRAIGRTVSIRVPPGTWWFRPSWERRDSPTIRWVLLGLALSFLPELPFLSALRPFRSRHTSTHIEPEYTHIALLFSSTAYLVRIYWAPVMC